MKTFDRRSRGTSKLSAANLSAFRDKSLYDSQSSSQDSPSPQGVSRPFHPADPYDFDVDKADEQPGPVDSSPGATHAAASTGQQLESFTISRPPAANKAAGKFSTAYGSGNVHKRSLLGARSSRALPPAAEAAPAAAAEARKGSVLPAVEADGSIPISRDADRQHTSNPAPAAAGVKRARHAAQLDSHTQQAAPVAASFSVPDPTAAAEEEVGSTTRMLANSQSAQPQPVAGSQQAPRVWPTATGSSQQPVPAATDTAAAMTGRYGPIAETASQGRQPVPCAAGSAQLGVPRASGRPTQMSAGSAPLGSASAPHPKPSSSNSSGGKAGRGIGGGKRSNTLRATGSGSQSKAAQAAAVDPAGDGSGGGGSQAQEARPVQTIMEAQERGELVALQDGARYALDGLMLGAGGGGAAAREGALALAELLGSRKGRLALRADGLAQQALSAAAKACAATKDEVLLGASALMLLSLSAEDAHPAYLASTAAACLMSQLLAPGSPNSSGVGEAGVRAHDPTAAWNPPGSNGQRLLQLASASPLVRGLGPEVPLSPQSMLLAALTNATACDAPARLAACDKLKANLGRYGVLGGVVGLLAAAAGAVKAASSSLQGAAVIVADPQRVVAAAALLRLGLVVLENSTFTCPANSTELLGLEVPGVGSVAPLVVALARALLTRATTACAAGSGGSWDSPGSSTRLHPATQLQQEQQGQGQEPAGGAAAVAALQAALSVLMNLSHASDGGAACVGGAGAGALAVEVLGVLLGPAAAAGKAALAAQVLAHADLLAVALGLLINLASTGQQHTAQLLDATLLQPRPPLIQQQQQQGAGTTAPAVVKSRGTNGSGCGGGLNGSEAAAADAAPPGLLSLLCAVMRATGQEPDVAVASPRSAFPDCSSLPATSADPALPAAVPEATRNVSSPPAAAGASCAPSGSGRLARRSGAAGQLTEAALAAHGASSAASIVEVYSGVLLGSLVASSQEAAATIAPLLPGGDLGVVVAAVGRCLAFYVATGAITGSSRAKLEGLLEALQQYTGHSTMQE